MDFYSLADNKVEEEIGRRLRALRLRKNITQQELAGATLLSLNSIKSLEAGKGKLSTLIAVLRELGALDQFDGFILDPRVSPMQLARMQGKTRERASGERVKEKSKGDIEW